MEKNDKVNNVIMPSAIPDNDTDDIYPGEENLDRRWAWVVMIAALLTHILTFGASYASVGALYVEFLNDFGGSESATSLPGSIMLGTMLCAGPLASILVGKFGARAVAVSGGLFASSGLILSAFAKELVHLYFTFGFLTGLGYGFSYLPCIVMVGNFFEKKRVVAGGIAVSGSGLGTFIVAPIVQSLLEALAYRKTLIVLGAIELILCLCGAMYIPNKIPVRKVEQGGIGVEDEELGSGSVLAVSVLDGTALHRLSDVSCLMQAALTTSGLSFAGQSRSQMRQATATNSRLAALGMLGDDVESRTPLPQLSDGSVLAQAALCLSRFSPSMSSSIVSSSSSKVNDDVPPAIAGSPIKSIPEEWKENLQVVENNDDTLVPKRKSDFPPIPEEFIVAGSTPTHGFDTNNNGNAATPLAMSPKGDNTDDSESPHKERATCTSTPTNNGNVLEEQVDDTSTQPSRISSYRGSAATSPGPTDDTSTQPSRISSYRGSAATSPGPTDDTSTQPSRISSYRGSAATSPGPTVDINTIVPTIQLNGHQFKPDDERGLSSSQLSTLSSLVCPKSSSHSTQAKTCWEQVLAIAQLFKNRFFLLFCLSNLFVCIGYQLPYMYFKAFALSMDLGHDSWAVILSVMGVADTLGRILVGFCFGYVHTDYGRLYGFVASMVLAGVILLFTCLADSYVSLFCYAGGFALIAGCTDGLVGPLLVGFVGLEQLGYSFGMIIEMQGIGFVLGPPLAGFLYSLTGTYAAVFCTGGIAFILSGLVLLLEPLIAYCRKEAWTYQREV